MSQTKPGCTTTTRQTVSAVEGWGGLDASTLQLSTPPRASAPPAPVAYRAHRPTPPTVFSCGVVLFEMLTGELPFRQLCQYTPGPTRPSDGSWTREHVLQLMQDDKPWPEAGKVAAALAAAAEGAAAADGRAGAGVAYERELCALLRGMLRFDPRVRWSLEQVRANVWFRGRLGEEALEAAVRGRELLQSQDGGADGGGGEVVGGTCLEVQERVRSACDAFRREVARERVQQHPQALHEERRRLEGRLRHLHYERELLQRDEARVRQQLLWVQQTEQVLQQAREQQVQPQKQATGHEQAQQQEQQQQRPPANADVPMSPSASLSASPSRDDGDGEEDARRKGELAQEQGQQPLQEEGGEPQGQQDGKAEEEAEPRDEAAPERGQQEGQEGPQNKQGGEDQQGGRQPEEQGGEQQGGQQPKEQQR